MTIILHGDHGSRIRLLDESEKHERAKLQVVTRFCPAESRYDYVSAPNRQDLLNRFSTKFAVKTPGARKPVMVRGNRSVLDLLWSSAGLTPPPGGLPGETAMNSVYLFDADGFPKRIAIRDVLKENRKEE